MKPSEHRAQSRLYVKTHRSPPKMDQTAHPSGHTACETNRSEEFNRQIREVREIRDIR